MSNATTTTQSLSKFRGIACCGGFSYGDTFGAGRGWASTIKGNKVAAEEFEAFFNRKDTFALGVCKRFVHTHPTPTRKTRRAYSPPVRHPPNIHPITLTHRCATVARCSAPCGTLCRVRRSGRSSRTTRARRYRLPSLPSSPPQCPTPPSLSPPHPTHDNTQYEARVCMAKVEEGSKSVFFQGMEGSAIPVVVSHGEGRAEFRNEGDVDAVDVTLRYVNSKGEPTQRFPANPNGSPNAIAAVCSEDGRVTAMMPHPERVLRSVANSWSPDQEFDGSKPWGDFSPWLKVCLAYHPALNTPPPPTHTPAHTVLRQRQEVVRRAQGVGRWVYPFTPLQQQQYPPPSPSPQTPPNHHSFFSFLYALSFFVRVLVLGGGVGACACVCEKSHCAIMSETPVFLLLLLRRYLFARSFFFFTSFGVFFFIAKKRRPKNYVRREKKEVGQAEKNGTSTPPPPPTHYAHE